MKNIFIFTFIIISNLILAQNFAPIGAKWNYHKESYYLPLKVSYEEYESIKDTLIKDKNCKIIKVTDHFSNPSVINYQYIYSSNDSVWYYKFDEFHLLYNFNANKNETYTIYEPNTLYPYEVLVDSTSSININGVTRKVQYVTCFDIAIDFSGVVIQNIGNLYSFFPSGEFSALGPLRCYTDNVIGHFQNEYYTISNWNEECNYVYTSIEDIKKNNNVIISSINKEGIVLDGLFDASNYRIYNINGELVKFGVVSNLEIIPLHNQKCKGVFFIIVNNSKQNQTLRIFKKY